MWFLGGHDTPGQDPLWSLEDWNHGRALDEIVRLVRLTRPEVILTWLPDYVAGENHDDHQAAGILATEAFDLAADPTAFSEQVSMPRREGDMYMTEGLRPWQPKKIYYFTDAFDAFSEYWNEKPNASPFRKNFLEGQGPEYANAVVSPSRHASYGRLAAEEQSYYLTQGTGSLAKEALTKGDLSGFELPIQFIVGKSVVKCRVTGDIFEGIVPSPAPFARVPGFQPQIHEGLSLELGGPWAFYQEFWRAHNLERLAQLLPVPEVAIDFGSALHVPLVIRNGTEDSEEVSLTVALPHGWTERTGSARYPIRAHDLYPARAALVAPATGKVEWQEITWKAAVGAREIGSVSLHVLLGRSGGMPQ